MNKTRKPRTITFSFPDGTSRTLEIGKIECKGFGSIHGYAKGRLWIVCEGCRWGKHEK